MRHGGAGSGERYATVWRPPRVRGITLIELVVAIAILGFILGISGLAWASLRAPRESEVVRELRHARAEAIRTGTPLRAVLSSDTAGYRSRLPAPLFLPDGRALGPGFDPLTGAPRASAR